jgi:hypothetical protein
MQLLLAEVVLVHHKLMAQVALAVEQEDFLLVGLGFLIL